jgi:hypothetical protein
MKPTYKVKLTPHTIIIRVEEGKEEIIFDKKHIKIHKAEKICQDLNEGVTINWDDLK